jgi:hypothetical protein
MKEMIWHMLSGAGSLLDISGHSKVSESQFRSMRIKSDDDSFYTLPMSDQLNHTTDLANLTCDGMNWMPEEGRKAVQSWLKACQQERDRFKTFVGEDLSNHEKLLIAENEKRSKKHK